MTYFGPVNSIDVPKRTIRNETPFSLHVTDEVMGKFASKRLTAEETSAGYDKAVNFEFKIIEK